MGDGWIFLARMKSLEEALMRTSERSTGAGMRVGRTNDIEVIKRGTRMRKTAKSPGITKRIAEDTGAIQKTAIEMIGKEDVGVFRRTEIRTRRGGDGVDHALPKNMDARNHDVVQDHLRESGPNHRGRRNHIDLAKNRNQNPRQTMIQIR